MQVKNKRNTKETTVRDIKSGETFRLIASDTYWVKVFPISCSIGIVATDHTWCMNPKTGEICHVNLNVSAERVNGKLVVTD